MSALRPIPSHYDELFPTQAVEEGVRQVAAEITPWAVDVLQRTGGQVLAVCILRGAVFFFSDLLKAVPVSIEATFCRCRGYVPNVNGGLAERVAVEWSEADFKGRHVLLLDDICDTGRTMAHMRGFCVERGAVEVRAAVLVHRLLEKPFFSPDFAAFRYPGKEWLAGYGMEDSSWHMNYPAIYRLRGSGEG